MAVGMRAGQDVLAARKRLVIAAGEEKLLRQVQTETPVHIGGDYGVLKIIGMAIALTAEIDERRYPCNPDCRVHESLSPNSAERIGNDDAASEDLSQLARRAIRVLRKKTYGVRTLDVRLIDARICTNKAVMRFADDDVASHSDDAT